jgi:MGT family glycosyltransferase
LPEFLDFPSSWKPKQLFYTGPFFDSHGRRAVKFPWERMTDKPLIYASMGTRYNDEQQIFHTIAEACKDIAAQLVISTGGNLSEIGALAGNPIVVPYAPQPELLSKASLTITHAGANTTLESLLNGVPLVAIPIADDLIGTAARIEWAGVGAVVPFKKVTLEKLQKAIKEVLENPEYSAVARKMQTRLQGKDWLESAADIVESALK